MVKRIAILLALAFVCTGATECERDDDRRPTYQRHHKRYVEHRDVGDMILTPGMASPIPEPTGAVLFGLGMLVFGVCWYRITRENEKE